MHLWGGDGSAIAGHDSTTTGTISRSTRSIVAQGAAILADSLVVKAEATQMKVEIDATLGAVGVVGGGTGDTATATISGDVEAYIRSGEGIDADGRVDGDRRDERRHRRGPCGPSSPPPRPRTAAPARC